MGKITAKELKKFLELFDDNTPIAINGEFKFWMIKGYNGQNVIDITTDITKFCTIK